MKKSLRSQLTPAREILNALLSGVLPEELQPALSRLSPEELQNVLCTACSKYDEFSASAQPHIQRFLKANCRIFTAERKVCPINLFYRLDAGGGAASGVDDREE